ncbi:4-(cytidine 5'-diphospho)-2-C-methyl-D-erythritol kinase [Ligilactobacillus faecis]|uniref:4-(cytidine 5'-diphospho)-2-C-methyl-D-erythritol kinase n=1 Tax=Ligilactobacillus faecis TaxID=762833 RepID=UPI002469423F|nr:4-(cytidine 5'-diphospho)-2-C-methyl-D-erythritol kinase [Ligilactobacillus faecis]WGN88745.1 4-(cytidine 5'-diphospho)-2-C-methyl-D-erythritol kinase [Ligilactobacillus faecis]
MEISEKAPAKLNFSLDTPFRHQNGEQEWKMVMIAVDLADYVHIKTSKKLKEITVKTDSGFLPIDQRNLAYQAAKKLKERYQIDAGVEIVIDKKIPVAAGMGGGSSDAAAVLRGLNTLWNLGLSKAQLAKIGLEIDSDVPFCVYSEPALVTGKGEVVTPIGALPPLKLIIAKPRDSVSTPSILRRIDYNAIEHQDVEGVVEAIKQKDYSQMIEKMGNALEPITADRHPEILKIKQKMLTFGCDVAQMSGSGPTVFGICQKASRAQHVYNSLRGFCKEVYIVSPYSMS